MLEAHNLSCIRDERALFDGLSLRVSPGEMVQVEGPNGAGKTALLRILAGLALPDAGSVDWQRRPIDRHRQRYHRDLLYIGHHSGVKTRLTAFENLAFSQIAGGARRDENAIWRALDNAGLLGYEEVPARELSAGQLRRVALARLWLSSAALWILDEPLNAIDQLGGERLMSLFTRHCAGGGMLVLTTHQPLPGPAAGVRKVRLAPAIGLPLARGAGGAGNLPGREPGPVDEVPPCSG